MTMQPANNPTIDYAAKIRDRIKASLVDIIPDDQWSAMIQTEVDRFLKSSEVQRTYQYQSDRVHIPSGFTTVVNEVLKEETIRRVKEMLLQPEWAGHWTGTGRVVGEKVAAIVRENSSAIIEAWLGEQVQRIIAGMR